jgi:hypothetical protein
MIDIKMCGLLLMGMKEFIKSAVRTSKNKGERRLRIGKNSLTI